MTEEQHDIIIKLRDKVRTLINLYEKTKKEKLSLQEDNSELLSNLSVKQKEIENLEKKYNTLKLAKAMSGDSEESHEAKVKVNKIVREIDKCIALLNK